MDVGRDGYHVRINHHTAAPAALAEAQLALLNRRSVDAGLAASRAWRRRGVVVAGLAVAVGLLLLLLAAPSAGRATAYENCLADAEGMASKLSAVQSDGELGAQPASAEDLCAGYRA